MTSGWTECTGRDAAPVWGSLQALRSQLPSALRGLDADDGSEFLNEALLACCQKQIIEFTRSLPYHKNDQARVEQKNGAVARRLVAYERLEGVCSGRRAAAALQCLTAVRRLLPALLQARGEGVQRRTYHQLPTCAANARRVPAGLAGCFRSGHAAAAGHRQPPSLLASLDEIRHAQRQLAIIADGTVPAATARRDTDLSRFPATLAVGWCGGEVRLTHQAEPESPRHWRTRADPFEAVGSWVQ